ncbi:transcription elongation factor GreA [Patescibacteria group bacterium]|nr:transcription elongation factor GreA [Patescibacteria group bacterium]
MIEDQTYITKEKLKELKKELDYLKTTKRREIANRIREAKELGDLSENAEYADAKDEQGWTEGRILKIEDILRRAVLIESNHKNHSAIINVGSKIKVKVSDSEKNFEITGSQEADPPNGKISNESPLGKAFLGKKAGDEVEVEVPKGVIKYKIIAIS